MADAPFLAPALVEFREELDDKYPQRDKASDGWIGDTSHAARPSDHNPCRTCTGRSKNIVRAIDVDNNGKPGEVTPLVKDVLAAAIGDPRVWYVIYNRVIYSRTYGFAPRAYTGSNPHDKHVHVSLNGANGVSGDPGNFDTSSWLVTEEEPVQVHIGEALDHAIADVRSALRRKRAKLREAREAGDSRRAKALRVVVAALAHDLGELRETRKNFPR